MWGFKKKLKEQGNPHHAPPGTSKGGQFTSGQGSGGGKSDDKDKPKKEPILKQLDLNQDRINTIKQNFSNSPQLSDEGDTFRDFSVRASDGIRHMSNAEADEFEKQLELGNHEKTDEMFIKAIKKDPKLFQSFKENTEEVEAFNEALKDRLSKTDQVHRFISLDELDNYVDTGEFQSRKNDFVAFTVEKRSVFFGERDVTISIPAEDIRKNLKPLKYSSFPRNEDEKKEKIDSEKHQSFAIEVEARLPSKTKIPANLDITVNTFVSPEEAEEMKIKYGKLGKITFKNIMRR